MTLVRPSHHDGNWIPPFEAGTVRRHRSMRRLAPVSAATRVFNDESPAACLRARGSRAVGAVSAAVKVKGAGTGWWPNITSVPA